VEKFYRSWITTPSLYKYEIRYKESDLFIQSDKDLRKKALNALKKYRHKIESYIKGNPLFRESLIPVPVSDSAPEIVREMARAGEIANVGPMASVAGAIAEFVGKDLEKFCKEIIVENGGDIYMKIEEHKTVGIYAGDSPLSGRIGIQINKDMTPCGVCTSSGKVGHSLSFGQADAVTVITDSATLSDALATSFGNMLKDEKDMDKVIDSAKNLKEIRGIVIVFRDKLAVYGDIKLVEI
jgi:hypothetical protein